MADLSPAAQAVLSTFFEGPGPINRSIAAVLRAAADQVVPENLQESQYFTTEAIRLNLMGVRGKLLAIADELEGQ
jgi:hypothetical protein